MTALIPPLLEGDGKHRRAARRSQLGEIGGSDVVIPAQSSVLVGELSIYSYQLLTSEAISLGRQLKRKQNREAWLSGIDAAVEAVGLARLKADAKEKGSIVAKKLLELKQRRQAEDKAQGRDSGGGAEL